MVFMGSFCRGFSTRHKGQLYKNRFRTLVDACLVSQLLWVWLLWPLPLNEQIKLYFHKEQQLFHHYSFWLIQLTIIEKSFRLASHQLTSFLISHSRFRIQSSFLLRQRWAAMRFLLRRLTSWINSSCSEVSLCIFNNIWKSFRGRFVIWSTGKGSFTWRKIEKSKYSKMHKLIDLFESL